MKIKFEWEISSVPPSAPQAISICLYESDRFDRDKHIIPLIDYMGRRAAERYDLLLYIQRGMESLLPEPRPGERRFFFDKTKSPYEAHFYRYLGADQWGNYQGVWFRGADTPEVPHREKHLVDLCLAESLEAVIFPSVEPPFRCCTGRLFAAKATLRGLFQKMLGHDPVALEWNCDEEFLSKWLMDANPPAVIAIDRSVRISEFKSFIQTRMEKGRQTIVWKDRDDSRV